MSAELILLEAAVRAANLLRIETSGGVVSEHDRIECKNSLLDAIRGMTQTLQSPKENIDELRILEEHEKRNGPRRIMKLCSRSIFRSLGN